MAYGIYYIFMTALNMSTSVIVYIEHSWQLSCVKPVQREISTHNVSHANKW